MAQGELSTRHLHLNDLLGLLPWVPAGPVCEIGSGTGALAAAMASYGLPVTALDVDAAAVAQARQRYGDDVEWHHCDIRHYRLQRESYAALFCLDVFPYIPNGERARLIGRLKAAVRPGGLIAISGLGAGDLAAGARLARAAGGVALMPTGVFQPDELEARFRDWEILFRYAGSAPQAGLKTPGLRRIVELVARKPREPVTLDWSRLPILGAGLVWQPGQDLDGADFLEIAAEGFLEPGDDSLLARLGRRQALIPVSRTLSPGTPGLRGDGSLEALERVIARCGGPWWGEQLGFTRSEQLGSYSLQPLPATEESLEVVKRNVRELRRRMPAPLLLQPHGTAFRQDQMDRASFVRHVSEEADCGLLLDLAALAREQPDPLAWIERLPRERILQLRLPPALWDLAVQVAARCSPRAISIAGVSAAEWPELRQRVRALIGSPA